MIRRQQLALQYAEPNLNLIKPRGVFRQPEYLNSEWPLLEFALFFQPGIKQGKGTFSFTKLRVRSAAGIHLLGQFALFFWPNFVRWASSWMADQVQDEHACFGQVLQEVRTQVRTAANTAAIVLTNASGQLLEFAHNGPYPGVQVRLDGPFVYQFPMPLFQAWECLWPVSSESVKEQVAALVADKGPSALTEALFAQLGVRSPEKVAKIGLDDRLVL
jgi:hypothetical protein